MDNYLILRNLDLAGRRQAVKALKKLICVVAYKSRPQTTPARLVGPIYVDLYIPCSSKLRPIIYTYSALHLVLLCVLSFRALSRNIAP